MKRAALVFVVLVASRVSAADAPRLAVVLRCEPHASLTPLFLQDLQTRLRAGFSGCVGPTEIRLFDDRSGGPSPLFWRLAFARGLDPIEPPTTATAHKTHFVDVRVTGASFQVRSRQYDAALGWPSPAVRVGVTADRANLFRLIVSQVIRDYGLTGTVKSSDGDRTVMLALPPHADGNAWVKPGDLFAVIQTVRPGQSVRVPNTLLRAVREPEAGLVECRIESRYQKPLAGWEGGHFRAVKLGCERGPARVRIRGGDQAADRLTVRVAAGDDSGAGADVAQFRRGVYTSREPYDRVAFVRVYSGDRLLAQAPVEILGDAPADIQLKGEDGGGELIDVDARICRSRLLDLLARLTEENERLAPLVRDGKNGRALELVKALMPRLEDELVQLAGEVGRLRARLTPADAESLERFLKQARERQMQFDRLLKELGRAVEAAKAPAAEQKQESLRALIARAERDVDDGDVDAAIAIYEQVVRESGNGPEPLKRLNELKTAWAVKSDEHRQARETIYQTWAKCRTADDVEQRCDAAFKALNICTKVGDRFAARKALAASVKASEILARRDEELRQVGGEDATKKLEQLRQTATKVRAILQDAEKAAK